MTNLLAFSDDRKLLVELKSILSTENYVVAFSTVSQLFLKRLSSASFDLVIIDLDVPDIDVVYLIKSIRSISPETQILLVLSHDEMSQLSEYLELGVGDILVKPVHPQVVKKRIESAIARII